MPSSTSLESWTDPIDPLSRLLLLEEPLEMQLGKDSYRGNVVYKGTITKRRPVSGSPKPRLEKTIIIGEVKIEKRECYFDSYASRKKDARKQESELLTILQDVSVIVGSKISRATWKWADSGTIWRNVLAIAEEGDEVVPKRNSFIGSWRWWGEEFIFESFGV